MLDQQAELLATEPLEALADAIAGLSGHVAGQLAETEADFMPRFRRLQRAQQAAREAVWAAEAAVARAEEPEERRAAERWLEDAEEAERRLDAAMDEVQSALGRYKAEARELNGARRGIFSEAARHLQTLVSNAKAYSAVAVSSGAASGFGGGEGAAVAPIKAPDLSTIALPPGFAWIPIACIVPDQFIDLADDPPKGVSVETIERGMRRFYSDLVPILQSNARMTRDELAEIDRAQGTLQTSEGSVHPESLSNLGDIFLFGRDVMAAEIDEAGRYSFNSGRHRATVARNLGLTHVPARVLAPSGDR